MKNQTCSPTYLNPLIQNELISVLAEEVSAI